jgi:hypothetical protein
MAKQSAPPLVPALLAMKCPNCRKGSIFVNKHVLPLKGSLDMVEHCSECGMKMVRETNNGFGINYALTVMMFFFNLVWYIPIFGMSYEDNSIYYFVASSSLVTLLLQPWFLRLSRVLFLYFTVGYRSKTATGNNH